MTIGIVGTGFMAGVHCRSLLKLDGVTVVAVCGTSMDKARAFIATNNLAGAQPYADFDGILARTPLDALYVCLPPDAHHGQVVAAARKGIHLFLEKPLALHLRDAGDMVTAIAQAGVQSQVSFHLRFRKAVRAVKALADAGTLGRPTLFTGRFWCNMEGHAWWRDKNRSGGQHFEQAIHLYDLAAHLLGTPVAAAGFIANLGHTRQPDYTIEDTGAGMVRFANGAIATVTSSNCAVRDRYIADFRVVFEHGMLDYASTGDWRVNDEAVLQHAGTETRFVEDGNPHFEATADFINAVRSGGTTLTPARDGLVAQHLVAAVFASAAGGAFISLPPLP